MNKKPLIIDTDFTKDDIIAIKLLADSDKYDIKAITCYGEWFVETVQLRNSMGLDCPVCWGAMKPLFRPEISENVYGNTSPDTTEKVRIEEKDEQYPWDTIYSTALEADGELEIVTLGPVTNIALTLLRYPQIKPMIKRIFCFAGSGYSGNVAPYSEYNAYADPDALKIVFDSGVDIVMCGLDITMKSYTTMEDILRLKATDTKAGDFCAEAFGVYYDRYVNNSRLPGCAVHDAVAVTYLLHPEWIESKRGNVKVDIDGGETYGQTVCDFRPNRNRHLDNATVCLDIDREKFVDLLVKACESYK